MATRRTDVSLDTQSHDRHTARAPKRRVLVVGELAASLRLALVERGAELELVADPSDAFGLLADQPWDVVVLPGAPWAVDVVNAIKEGATEHERTIATLYGARGDATFMRDVRPPAPEVLEAVRRRHRLTPFVLLPHASEPSYFVIVAPPEASWGYHPAQVPIVNTIMTVSAAALLGKSTALA